jgi:hypothetical protein
MKRLLHALFSLLAIATLAGCLFAIWWIWSVKKTAFNEGDKYLSIADKTLADVSNQLKSQVFLVKTTFKNDDTQGFFGSFVGRSMARQLAPSVNDAQLTLERLTEASIVVNSILESLQEGPLDKLDSNQVRNLQTQMEGVTKASWDLGDLLNNPQSPGGESATEKSQRVAANLETIIGLLNDYQRRIQSLQSSVQQMRKRTLYWMNLGPTLATIALSWIAISQLVVLTVVLKSFRKSLI